MAENRKLPHQVLEPDIAGESVGLFSALNCYGPLQRCPCGEGAATVLEGSFCVPRESDRLLPQCSLSLGILLAALWDF